MQLQPQNFGRWLILAGLIMALLGAMIILLGQLGLFKLPGDLQFGSKNFKFYLPITSCIIISLILTLIFWIIRCLHR